MILGTRDIARFGGSSSDITFVGGYTEGIEGTISDVNISLTSLTGGTDTQPSAGDIVVVINGSSQYVVYTGTANLPTGYTNISGEDVRSDTASSHGRVSYKVMSATPDTTLTIPGGTGNANCAGSVSILVFRGVDQLTPLDVVYQKSLITNTVKANPPSITPSTPGAVIVAGGVGAHIRGTQTFTSSDLTNFISSGEDKIVDCTTGIGYKEWTTGAFDPIQFGFTSSDSVDFSSIGYTIALRPA